MSAIEDLNNDQEKLIFDLIESSVHTAVSLLHRLVKSGDGLQEVKDMEEKMRECLRESQSIGFGEMKRWWED